MRNQKLIIMSVFFVSLLVIIGTFVAAFSLANSNKIGTREDFSQTQYSYFSDNTASVNSQQTPEISDTSTSSEEQEPIVALTGTYLNGDNSITVNSGEDGFIEATAKVGEITMDFSGQTVDMTLTAIGTDSLGNTVEITITFGENSLTVETKSVTMADGINEYLNISGTFTK